MSFKYVALFPDDALLWLQCETHYPRWVDPRKNRPELWPRRYSCVVTDMRALTECDMRGTDALLGGMRIDESLSADPFLKIALIASEGSYGYSIARMFENATGESRNFEVRVVETPEAAAAWLGLRRPVESFASELAAAHLTPSQTGEVSAQ